MRSIGVIAVYMMCLAYPMQLLSAATYLTGRIEDEQSQKVEMPRLPGTWVRSVAWMAPEGEVVEAGDLIVTLDPGDLLTNLDTMKVELENSHLQGEAQLTANEVSIIDARIAMLQAESAVILARIDAEIPLEATIGLTHEQNQLNLVNAENAYERAKTQLTNLQEQRAKLIPYIEMNIQHATEAFEQVQNAIEQTEIRAEKRGLMIYGENPMTGEKIFPGQSFPPSAVLAMVANQSSLQFRFWVHEADIMKIIPDTRLSVTPDAVPQSTVPATVQWMSKQASNRDEWSEGGYFEVVARPLTTLPEDFVAGMSVVAVFDVDALNANNQQD